MSKRVPHCNKCQFCKCTELIYKSFYCEINHWNLGVDYAPLRSPKWCLLRSENVRKLHIQRLFDVLYKRNKLFMITLYHEFQNDIATDVCKRKFMSLLKNFENRNIIIWGSYRYNYYGDDRYILDYDSIIFYLTSVLDHYVCQKYGYTKMLESKTYIEGCLYEYYDSLLDLENSEIIEGRLIGTSPSGMPIYEGVI